MARGCLLNKALVVRAEDDVDEALALIEELGKHRVFLDELIVFLDDILVGLRLAALCRETNSLNLAVGRTHCKEYSELLS